MTTNRISAVAIALSIALRRCRTVRALRQGVTLKIRAREMQSEWNAFDGEVATTPAWSPSGNRFGGRDSVRDSGEQLEE